MVKKTLSRKQNTEQHEFTKTKTRTQLFPEQYQFF